MKRWTTAAMALLLALSLAACGGGEEASQLEVASSSSTLTVDTPQETSADAASSSQAQEDASLPPEESIQQEADEEGGGDRLVVYFTYGENAALPDGVDVSASASIQPWNGALTGNTGVVADMIAQATGADLFSIRTVEQYPDTYDATIDQGQQEQSDGARPELATHLENLDSYDTIFLGFPNWWGDMPMAVYTFLDEVDLSGKTVIPFVTSGGSGFSNTISTIQEMEPQATVQEGLSIGASSATGAQQQVESWLSELGLA